MSGGEAVRAINDARALLATFVAGDRAYVHVESGGTEIFIAREGGIANPLRTVADPPAAPATTAPLSVDRLTAPHVATIVSVLPVGSEVAAGEAIATLSVLGEKESLPAAKAGPVTKVLAEPGALVGYGDPIAEMAVAD